MADVRTHFSSDPWERHKIELTLNRAEVRGIDTPAPRPRAVENLRLTFDSPKTLQPAFRIRTFHIQEFNPKQYF